MLDCDAIIPYDTNVAYPVFFKLETKDKKKRKIVEGKAPKLEEKPKKEALV